MLKREMVDIGAILAHNVKTRATLWRSINGSEVKARLMSTESLSRIHISIGVGKLSANLISRSILENKYFAAVKPRTTGFRRREEKR